MLDSEYRNRPAGVTYERGEKTLDRRNCGTDAKSGRGSKSLTSAHRWVAARRAHRAARPAPRLPAHVAL